MAISASYLPPSEGEQRDPSSVVPELSRRARGFAAWAMIRHLGRDGIAEMVERHCRLSAKLVDLLQGEDGVEALFRPALNQSLFRFGDDDQATLDTVTEIQRDARIFVGPALWRGQWVMRVSIISFATQDEDIAIAAIAIAEAWRTVRARRA